MRNKITYYIDNSLIENRDHLVNSNVGQRLFPMKWIYCTFDKINIRLLLMPNFSFRRWWMFKLNFAKTIWWWQSGCKDGWTPDSISKIVWELKIKSLHEEELFKICVGLLISWCKPFCEVTYLIFLPSSLVISLLYQLLDLPSGQQTSFGRRMDVYMMSVRPSKIWYVWRTSK